MQSLAKMPGVKAYRKDDIPDYLMVHMLCNSRQYSRLLGVFTFLQIKSNPYILDVVLISDKNTLIQKVS